MAFYPIRNSYFQHYSKIILAKGTLDAQTLFQKLIKELDKKEYSGMHPELKKLLKQTTLGDFNYKAGFTAEVVYVPVFYIKCGLSHEWTTSRDDYQFDDFKVDGGTLHVTTKTTTTTQHRAGKTYDEWRHPYFTFLNMYSFKENSLMEINNPEGIKQGLCGEPSKVFLSEKDARDIIYKKAKEKTRGQITDFGYFCRCYLVPIIRFEIKTGQFEASMEANMNNGSTYFPKFTRDPIIKEKAQKWVKPLKAARFIALAPVGISFLIAKIMGIKYGDSVFVILLGAGVLAYTIYGIIKTYVSEQTITQIVYDDPKGATFWKAAKPVKTLVLHIIILSAIYILLFVLIFTLLHGKLGWSI